MGAVGVEGAAQNAGEKAEGISGPFAPQHKRRGPEEAVERKTDDDEGEDDLARVFVRPLEEDETEGDPPDGGDQQAPGKLPEIDNAPVLHEDNERQMVAIRARAAWAVFMPTGAMARSGMATRASVQ